MIIHTFEHEYSVSHRRVIDDNTENYICRNNAEDGYCSILSTDDRVLIRRLVPILSSTNSIAAFTDFIEHFMHDDRLCIVTSYTQGLTLADKLETESLALPEKLELARKVLERMILKEIPDYFLAKCADKNCIIVDGDMTLHFNYPIDDIAEIEQATRTEAMMRIAELLSYIFENERHTLASAELTSFFDSLDDLCKDGELIELYSAYHEMMTAIVASEKDREPDSIWHKLWEKIKKVASGLRVILMVILLVAAVIYLVWTVGDTKESGKRAQNFEKIGTIEIK